MDFQFVAAKAVAATGKAYRGRNHQKRLISHSPSSISTVLHVTGFAPDEIPRLLVELIKKRPRDYLCFLIGLCESAKNTKSAESLKLSLVGITAFETGSYKIFHEKFGKLKVETQVKIRLSEGSILSVYTANRHPENTAILLRFSCAQQFFTNTIYGILPNFPRQTFAVVSGVKIGLPQKLVF